MNGAVSTLDIVKLRLPEDAYLPEQRFLLAQTAARAREVYSVVEVRVLGPGERLPPAGADHVLVLGPPMVLLTARTLRALAQAAAEGFDHVRPARLADFDVLREEPVFTLGGYERVEGRIFAERLEPRNAPADPPPVALLSADLYSRALAGRPADELAAPSPEVAETMRSARAASRGVFHEFIDYYGQVREDILPFVPEGTRTVLEVGCGRGGTAELLEQRLGCRVTGVELNPVIAAEARGRIHAVVEGDVETLHLQGSFDLVLALEVVEHLVEPEAFLRRARSLVRPGGRIVLSTPNVGHYAVVEDLLAGRWDYVPSGAMCYTHLRFFTRSSLEDLLRRAGCERFRIEGQPTALPSRWSDDGGGDLPADRESLATLAFYVIIDL